MRKAVDTAIGSAVLPPRAAPGVELVRRYADLVDEGHDVTKLGPRIMATLRELGLGVGAGDGPLPEAPEHDEDEEVLDDLGERAGKRRTAAVHAAAAGA
jgi:hypothetical protein